MDDLILHLLKNKKEVCQMNELKLSKYKITHNDNDWLDFIPTKEEINKMGKAEIEWFAK